MSSGRVLAGAHHVQQLWALRLTHIRFVRVFFNRNSVFLSQQFSRNSVFQSISAKILPAEQGLALRTCIVKLVQLVKRNATSEQSDVEEGENREKKVGA